MAELLRRRRRSDAPESPTDESLFSSIDEEDRTARSRTGSDGNPVTDLGVPHRGAYREREGIATGWMASHGTPFVSRAVRATKGSSSLRVTVPQVVASTLGLGPGDELLWLVDPSSSSVRVEGRPRKK